MTRYSLGAIVRHALHRHESWPRAWRDASPRRAYDALIIGGGGHGLASAYYLAKEHGISDAAVLEPGWLGGGNTGRNTTVVRSNYLLDANERFLDFSMKLWAGMSDALNFNVMFSPRGIIDLAHSDQQLEEFTRRGNALSLNGIEVQLLDRQQIQDRVPARRLGEPRGPARPHPASYRAVP